MTQPVENTGELEAVVYASIAAWLAAVFPAVMATTPPDVSAMWRFTSLWVRSVDRLLPVLARLARLGWVRASRELGVDLPFDPEDPFLVEVLQRTRNLLVRVPDSTYRKVVRSLATGRDNGETQDQLARRVFDVLNIAGSENWPNRALVIARTETHRFDQAGYLASGRVLASRGRRLVKQWKDMDDPRVRMSHASVDRDIRPLGEPFHVGRSLLQYPIDPSGFAADVVSCRCVLVLREV